MSSLPGWVKDFKYTFYDSETLHSQHIQSVCGENWLVDPIIGFYYLYLGNDKFKDNKDLLFLTPPATMIARYASHEDAMDNLEPLGITKKNLIFIPINDQDGSTSLGGGSHWSLVVYDREKDQYSYLDSMKKMNVYHAKKFVGKIDKFINPGVMRFSIKLKPVKCQQQTNSSDCGVFLLAFSELTAEGKPVDSGIDCKRFRKNILDMIKKMSGN